MSSNDDPEERVGLMHQIDEERSGGTISALFETLRGGVRNIKDSWRRTGADVAEGREPSIEECAEGAKRTVRAVLGKFGL